MHLDSTEFVVRLFEFVILLFSISVHECAHAWTASRLGDQTARMLGRVTINPLAHIDPIGTFLIPAIAIFGPMFGIGYLGGLLIGWGRPTPVNTRNLRKIVRDDNLVSLAGPASNLLIALVAMLVLVAIALFVPQGRELVLDTFEGNYSTAGVGAVALLAFLAIFMNVSLCVFNLMPVPPLDGSHVVRNMLPYNAVRVYDRVSGWGSYLLMLLCARLVMPTVIEPVLNGIYSVLNHV